MSDYNPVSRNFHRACVTGGAGFIGSRLVKRLLERGIEVTVLDDLSTGLAANVPPDARLIQANLLDTVRCEEAVRGCDILFHLAARVAIRSSFEFVVEDTSTNVSGTASALRAAWKSGSVRKVITASSMGVYSDSSTPDPIAETHPTEPVAPYGISKLAAERLTHNMCEAAGIDSVALRLFNTYGKGQRLSPYVGVVTIFVNKLRKGQRPVIYGDGLQARDFVHVEDVVSGFVAAMDSPVSGETFNIGTGKARTVRSVFDALASVLRCSIEPEYLPAAAGELRYSVACIDKARTALGYAPKHEFESSISQVVEEIMSAAA
jgi:UDP-glucose 4-epimerase